MEEQLDIFSFGVEEPILHFENENIKNEDIVEINLENLDFNDEYNSIA